MTRAQVVFGAAVSVVVALACTACEGTETVEVENFDADHGLRDLRHERNLDFEWVNPRMHHVGLVITNLVDDMGSPTGEEQACTGVLVAPDLVLTAGHCLKDTGFLEDDCTVLPENGRGHFLLDQQLVQDADVGFPAPDTVRATRRVDIVRVAAHPSTLLYFPDTDMGGAEVCSTPFSNRHYDGVLLQLAEALPERGFARVRRSNPAVGELMPVIHHYGSESGKVVSAVRIRPDFPPGGMDIPMPEAHLAIPVNLPPGLENVQEGSSGAPMFDEDGFVVGLVSAPFGAGNVVFSSMDALFSLPAFQAHVTPAIEQHSFALGQFGDPPIGDFELTEADRWHERPPPLSFVKEVYVV